MFKKGPICAVSITGACRRGKSYFLSAVFQQPDVFPVGHGFDIETIGIWLWIVPKKYRVCFLNWFFLCIIVYNCFFFFFVFMFILLPPTT